MTQPHRSRRIFRTFAVALALGAASPALAEDPADLSKPGEEVQKLQERIRNDPEMMDAVEDLRSDPEMQSVLQDASVAAALQSGDLGTLLMNPKVQELMDNPAIEEIIRELED